ncbi:guanylate kinase [Agaribacter flavus]|uniref:Guanylate kinase n=1 Tax=Agaribacter flavus TaxID=1902781 RepID=A0ABV7FS65_9ALTE
MVQPLGNLFIVAAPSGAGKSSLINALLESAPQHNLLNPPELSVSHTTRQAREGEIDGVHYNFVSVDVFKQMIQQDAFYEHAEVFGNFYGTSKAAISDKLDQGVDVFLDIDWQGARQIKTISPEVISIFILPPSIAILEERLIGRGKDSADVIKKRMSQAKDEMSHAAEFDYILINDNFEETLKQLANIVLDKSLRADKQRTRNATLLETLL